MYNLFVQQTLSYYRRVSIKNCKSYDPKSTLLCGVVTAEDKITERKIKSLKEE